MAPALLLLLCPLLGALPGGLPTGKAAVAERPAVHPQDGPDADVRIFVDADAVRMEVAVNLAFLDFMVHAPHERDDWLDPVEYPGVREALFEYFQEVHRIVADGQVLQPIDRGFEVPTPDDSLLPLFPRMGMKALIRARISLEYPLEQPAQEVAITWGSYPPDIIIAVPGEEPPPMEINAQFAAHGVEMLVPFRADSPTYVWRDTGERPEDRFRALPEEEAPRPREVSLLSLGLIASWLLAAVLSRWVGTPRASWLWTSAPLVVVAAIFGAGYARVPLPGSSAGGDAVGLPSKERAAQLFEALHFNMYQSFGHRDVDQIYDSLARSVEGELLGELFTEVYDSLVLQEDGGAVLRITGLTPMKTEVQQIEVRDQAPHVEILARWQVDGSVFHWGHTHTRTNEVEARYTLRRGGEGWRIRTHQILEQLTTDASPLTPAGTGTPAPPAEREL